MSEGPEDRDDVVERVDRRVGVVWSEVAAGSGEAEAHVDFTSGVDGVLETRPALAGLGPEAFGGVECGAGAGPAELPGQVWVLASDLGCQSVNDAYQLDE